MFYVGPARAQHMSALKVMIYGNMGIERISHKAIQHHALVADPLEAIFLPSELSIVKCAVHTSGSDST